MWEHPSDKKFREIARDRRLCHERLDRIEEQRRRLERAKREQEELEAEERRIRAEFEAHEHRSRRKWGQGLGSSWWARAEGLLREGKVEPAAALMSPSRKHAAGRKTKKPMARAEGEDETRREIGEDRSRWWQEPNPSSPEARTPLQRRASKGRSLFKSVFAVRAGSPLRLGRVGAGKRGGGGGGGGGRGGVSTTVAPLWESRIGSFVYKRSPPSSGSSATGNKRKLKRMTKKETATRLGVQGTQPGAEACSFEVNVSLQPNERDDPTQSQEKARLTH